MDFPSDIKLLYESIRKSITLTARLCEDYQIDGWRQYNSLIRKFKKDLRNITKFKKSASNGNKEKSKQLHKSFVDRAGILLDKVEKSLSELQTKESVKLIIIAQILEIDKYIKYTRQHIDLIIRRVIQEEVIPHSDKIFSIFEQYTRWINKGKAGVLVELGVGLSVLKDQHGLILDYELMYDTSDVDVLIPMMKRSKSIYDAIVSCSVDKGFWSKPNRIKLGEIVPKPVMSKKGRLNKAEVIEHNDKEFKKLMCKHSSVESTINGLNHCGLDKCYDHGTEGLERCTGLSILARNIHSLGVFIREREEKRKKRKPHKKTA